MSVKQLPAVTGLTLSQTDRLLRSLKPRQQFSFQESTAIFNMFIMSHEQDRHQDIPAGMVTLSFYGRW